MCRRPGVPLLLRHDHYGPCQYQRRDALILNGLGGERELLVVSDLATGCSGAFLLVSKTAERVLSPLVRHSRHDRIANSHTDRAPELIAAVRELPGPHVLQHGVPVERACRGSRESR